MTALEETPSDSNVTDSNCRLPSKNMSRAAKLAGLLLLAVAVTAAGVATIVYSWNPQPNSAPFELMKASFSVFTVAVVGGLATFAFGILQRDRDNRQDEARRYVECCIDERRRRDVQVSVVLDDT